MQSLWAFLIGNTLKRNLLILGIICSLLGFGALPSEAKQRGVLKFIGHIDFAFNSYAFTPKQGSQAKALIRQNKKSTTFGVVGYAHRDEIGPPGLDGSPGSPLTLSKARADAIAVYLRLAFPKLKINSYGKGVKPNDTSDAGPRVDSLYALEMIGKKDPVLPSLSGTVLGTSAFVADNYYVKSVILRGPTKRTLKFPTDKTDGDSKQAWKFSKIKKGTYTVTIKMHTNQNGMCLSLQDKSSDKRITYGGKAMGWNIDPTDEFCDPEIDFQVFKTIVVKGTVRGQNFTIGMADLIGTV